MSRITRRGAAMLREAAVCRPRPAVADADYPKRPIRLIVPYASGDVPDISSRLLPQIRGASVVVENRLDVGRRSRNPLTIMPSFSVVDHNSSLPKVRTRR